MQMAGGGYPSPLTFGSDGTLWYTESDSTGVGHFNPADDSVTQVPLGQGSGFLYEWGITTGLDGNIWVGISLVLGRLVGVGHCQPCPRDRPSGERWPVEHAHKRCWTWT